MLICLLAPVGAECAIADEPAGQMSSGLGIATSAADLVISSARIPERPGLLENDSSDSTDSKMNLLAAINLPDNASARLADLDDRILTKEIELEQLNVHFRMETALVSKWRQRRLYAYGLTNAFLTEGSLLEQMPIRYQLSQPVHMPPAAAALSSTNQNKLRISLTRMRAQKNRGRFAFASEQQLTGNFIGIAGDTCEFSLNFLKYLRLRHDGMNPGAYHRRMKVLAAELDRLLAERNDLLAQPAVLSQPELNVAVAEGKLLKDIRDCGLFEYQEFHAATKNFWVLQNMAFLLDFTKNSTSAAANLYGLTGNHRRRPRYQGGSGVLSIISGAIVFVTPIVGRVTGNYSGVAARHLVSKELVNVERIDTNRFLADRKQLAALAAAGQDTGDVSADTSKRLTARLAVYEQEQELLTKMERYFKSQRSRARSSLVENVAFASIVAPARTTSGITSVIGGWRYWQDPDVHNGLYAAGTTAYAAGNAVGLLETSRLAITTEFNNAKLNRQHALPKQVLSDRLERLGKMSALIKQ